MNICYHGVAEVATPEYAIEREIPAAANLTDAI